MKIKQIKVSYMVIPFILFSCTDSNLNTKVEQTKVNDLKIQESEKIDSKSDNNIILKPDGSTNSVQISMNSESQKLTAKPEVNIDPNQMISKPDGNIDPNQLVSKPEGNIDPDHLVTKPEGNIDPGQLISKPDGNIDPNQLVSKPEGNIDPGKIAIGSGSADIDLAQGNYNLNVKINLLEFSIAALGDDPIGESNSLDINLKVDEKYENLKIAKNSFKGKGSFNLKLRGLNSSNKVNLYIATKDINGNTLLENSIYQDNITSNKSIDTKLLKVSATKSVKETPSPANDNSSKEKTPSPVPTILETPTATPSPTSSNVKTNNGQGQKK